LGNFIGGGDTEGGMPLPLLLDSLARKVEDTLIEQSITIVEQFLK